MAMQMTMVIITVNRRITMILINMKMGMYTTMIPISTIINLINMIMIAISMIIVPMNHIAINMYMVTSVIMLKNLALYK
jgi:hypothetical protein